MKACPLCGSKPTEFVQMIGVLWPFEMQLCSNPLCELPCKLWEQIRLLKEHVDVLNKSNELLQTERDNAREAAAMLYRSCQMVYAAPWDDNVYARWPWLKEK